MRPIVLTHSTLFDVFGLVWRTCFAPDQVSQCVWPLGGGCTVRKTRLDLFSIDTLFEVFVLGWRLYFASDQVSLIQYLYHERLSPGSRM